MTPALLWPGRIFFQGAWTALRSAHPAHGPADRDRTRRGVPARARNTVTATGPIYFDGVATLVFLLLVGRFLQLRAQRAAADSTELLHSLAPATARVVEADTVREVPTEALLPEMVIEVRPGETIAGRRRGHRRARPRSMRHCSRASRARWLARTGDRVWAGTTNLTAPIRVRVERDRGEQPCRAAPARGRIGGAPPGAGGGVGESPGRRVRGRGAAARGGDGRVLVAGRSHSRASTMPSPC